MGEIDWAGTPLDEFMGKHEDRGDGTSRYVLRPHGEGVPQNVMIVLAVTIGEGYYKLLGPEDTERMERAGEVPVIRDGERAYEPLAALTLTDLPVVLDALAVLQDEYDRQEREEA
ncbi:MAG: hypothetical protein M3R38_18140 [Actinomycetota bacterium]|nr:hypothetical protein [Actinomycetota bacterium]